MKLLANRYSLQGLVIYYASLFGFVTSCVAISQSSSPLKITGFILTLGVILIQDLDWLRRARIHPHDMGLIERLTDIFQDNSTDLFLKEHDFSRHVYDDTQLAPLQLIRDQWRGVDHEFVAPRYQQHWQAMRERLVVLLDMLEHNNVLKGSNIYHLLPPESEREPGPALERQLALAGKANTLARTVYDDYQGFRAIWINNRDVLRKG